LDFITTIVQYQDDWGEAYSQRATAVSEDVS
jgi:hypothetical protein